MKSKLCIVVVCFNRPKSLKRLLNSIENADYPEYVEVSLVISIDGGGDERVKIVADEFKWNKGIKEVQNHKDNLGVKKHVFYCISLSEKFENVLILEEDVFVSPQFFKYGLNALAFYENEDEIAGISLYRQPNNFNLRVPFSAIEDGTDVFFLQVPASSGQIISKKSWLSFKDWYGDGKSLDFESLPDNMKQWSSESWVKCYTKYLQDSGKTFVYPRISFTTNFGEVGHHSPIKSYAHQSQLLVNEKKYVFSAMSNSLSKYDSFFEYEPKLLYGLLGEKYKDLMVDLYGSRPIESLTSKYILTTKNSKSPIKSYGLELKPPEQNVLLNIEGKDIVLSRVNDVSTKSNVSAFTWMSYFYFNFSFYDVYSFIISKLRTKLR